MIGAKEEINQEINQEMKRTTVVMRRLATLAAIVLAMVALAAPAAWANTFTVTTTANPIAIGPCDAADCTLMEAITAANNNAQDDTINFAAGVSGDIELSSTTGGFSIQTDTSRLTINGPGAGVLVVDGNNATRAFGIASGAKATINGLTIKNGKAIAGDPNGGGISNSGTLTLNNSTVSDNTASFQGGGIYSSGALTLNDSDVINNRAGHVVNCCNGGGIRNSGELTLDSSTVSSNHAEFGGGGIYSIGSLLTLKNSTVVERNTARFGAGIYSVDTFFTLNDSTVNGNIGEEGGGIYSTGTLELNRSTVINNQAGANLSIGNAGGIYYRGATTLTLNDSTVSNNLTGGAGGGINITGGTVTLNGSTLSNNAAGLGLTNSGPGGGIYNLGGTVTLNDSTVDNHNTAFNGAGINNTSTGTLTLNDSTVSNNASRASGGGIETRGTLTLDGSTVSNNSAGVYGGGITSLTNLSDRSTTIRNSTISRNTAAGSAAEPRGGGILNIVGLTRIENSTIAFNTALAGEGSGVVSEGNANTSTEVLSTIISGNANNSDVERFGTVNSFQSFGYNLIGGGNSTSAFNQPGDRTGVTTPGLGPLTNNGGPTQTHALLPGSPAIDAGSNANCPSTDQRGQTRPKDGDGNATATCDIGAFEKEAAPPPPNRAPVARNNSYSVKEDAILRVPRLRGVLANDYDSNGDRLSARKVTTTRHGTLTLRADGSLVYNSRRDFAGIDTFYYRAFDGKALSNQAKVSIRVRPVAG